MNGTIRHLCVSERKGRKRAVPSIEFRPGHGVEGDFHAGTWHRQVSLLSEERIDEMRVALRERAAASSESGERADPLDVTLEPGAFGENVVVAGCDPADLALGQRFRIGRDAVLQVTQHGKECHTRCAIYYQAGDCIMPTRGVFARVLRSGTVRPGDELRTDETLDVVRYAVLTLSDKGARGEREDTSGPLAVELLSRGLEGRLVAAEVLPDERAGIERRLVRLSDEEVCDLIVTTGGTGLSPRDMTPEATLAVCDREVPGMAEAMRRAGMEKTPRAMLSRGVCAMRGQTLVINLSGSPKAVREQLEAVLPVLPHALATITGIPQDCAR